MNFLQLCRAVALDSGTVAGVPNFNTVAGATGRVAQVVGWVRDAYVDIQNERPDWRWMRRDFLAPLTIGQAVYTPAQLGVADHGTWIGDNPPLGFRNLSLFEDGHPEREGAIRQIPYSLYRERYVLGVHDANQPTEWAITPRDELAFGNKPDKAYRVRGQYVMAPEELEADDDVPSMPARFHRVIVQEAMRLMARSDEAFQVLEEKGQQYDRLRSGLVREQTPGVSMDGPPFA